MGSCLAAADDSQVCRNFMQMNAGAAAPVEIFDSFKDLLRRPHGLLCNLVVVSFRFGRSRPLQQLLRDLEEQASQPRPAVPKALIVENMLGFRQYGPVKRSHSIKSLRRRGWVASRRTLCASTFGLPLRGVLLLSAQKRKTSCLKHAQSNRSETAAPVATAMTCSLSASRCSKEWLSSFCISAL